MLESWLDFHRATLLLKCDGVPTDRLADRTVPPSSLSLLGLVRHMVDVERHWFLHVLPGVPRERGLYWTEDNPDGEFENIGAEDVEDAFKQFDVACELARENAAGIEDLDWQTPPDRHGRVYTLRWIYVHMIEEYARHNGHADLIREALDGVTGE